MLADMFESGQRTLTAKGGNGGWGNRRCKSSTNQAPRRANPGQPAVERTLLLRLKLIADAVAAGKAQAAIQQQAASEGAAREAAKKAEAKAAAEKAAADEPVATS